MIYRKIKDISYDTITDRKLSEVWQFPAFSARMFITFEGNLPLSANKNTLMLTATEYQFIRDELNSIIGPDAWKFSFMGTGIYVESVAHIIQYQLSRNF